MPRSKQLDNPDFKRVKLYFETFSTESGIATMKDLRKRYYDRLSYVPGDTHEMAFREGQKSIIFDILSDLKLSQHPELFEAVEDEYQD